MRFDWLNDEELEREIALMRRVIAESKVNATVRHAKWALQKAEASRAGRGAAATTIGVDLSKAPDVTAWAEFTADGNLLRWTTDPEQAAQWRAENAQIELVEVLPAMSGGSFQSRVKPWLLACFGAAIAGDREERNHRFLEEALELVQACGCTAGEAHQLVDYTFGRPEGHKNQEVGGVMVTLAALCLANDLDMHRAAEIELSRIWTKVEQIRAKQAAKPKHSPLPERPEAAG